MEFKYRVKGLIERSFILRGAYFAINDTIDFYIKENELQFVKERCKIEELLDLETKPIETPKPVLEETENKPKEVKNELRPKPTRTSNKSKNKANL